MAPENREKALAAIREVLAQVLKEGFSSAEIERARKDLIEARIQRRASDGALVDRLSWLVERDLDWRYTEAWDERYRRITLAEVNAALRKHMKPDAWVISSAGDYAKKPPQP
jgi:zinc protease